MMVVSALVFVSALALVVAVLVGTLLPSWTRIVAVLTGKPMPQQRLVLARRHRVVRPDRRATRLAARLSEAA